MQSSTIKFWVCSGSILFYLLAPKPTTAQQIVPDTTLPNNSIVLPNGNTFEIKDGTTVGNNLFHSFEKFSISDGGSANFNNALTIQNIITRVTGKDISNIDGKISANGTANLFLLNPNGIIFGPKASLNIGGSFIASTASSLKFADGTEFRTDSTQTTPLLTISVPMGLQFGANPQAIVNRSQFNVEVGLEVKPGKTLALVGGDVVLDGGFLTAPGGRIELGSVAGNNSVSLKQIDQSWVLGYEGIQNFQDISLSKEAYVNTEGEKGGDIQIQGRNVTLTGGSQIVAAQGDRISSSVNRTSQPGNIKINALEKLELVGSATDTFSTGIFNQVRRGSQGGAGSLQIETKQLIVRGAQLSANTDGGQGVDLKVNASESVELEGVPRRNTGLFTQARSNATGNGGNLTINTKRLTVRDGAQLATTTSGAGNAGNLAINASESVLLKGTTINGSSSSGLYAQVQGNGATGNAGDLTIETKTLQVLEGAQISAATLSAGNGGNLTINASDILLSGTTTQAKPTPEDLNRSGVFVAAFKNNLNDPRVLGDVGQLNIRSEQLTVENGARVSANNFSSGREGSATLDVGKLVIQNGGEVTAQSFAQGSGGTLKVNASESVQVIGTGTIDSTTVPSTLSAEATSSGSAGDLNIQTPRLDVRDGGQVTVSATGSGFAGNLNVAADFINLDNRGSLLASSVVSGAKNGNIFLQVKDILLMRRGSLIANTNFGGGDGGNFNADVGFVVAVPNENSDISASAFTGRGGNIQIRAQGIFGTEIRDAPTPLSSDITASGTVTLNTPEAIPRVELVELPTVLADISNIIDTSCAAFANGEGNSFTMTGRGGLPPSPNEPLTTDVIWSDNRIPNIASQQRSEKPSTKPATKDDAVKIVPATGWVFDGKGNVTLISHASNANNLGSTPACQKQ